jgi:hypothetical protein
LHDTFSEVYAVIDTDQLSVCFPRRVDGFANKIEVGGIAIDGKYLRRNLDKVSKNAANYAILAVKLSKWGYKLATSFRTPDIKKAENIQPFDFIWWGVRDSNPGPMD